MPVTKACNLTEDEIIHLIEHHGIHFRAETMADKIERVNYLHKRLKAFNDPVEEAKPAAANVNSGWGSPNGS